MENTTEEVKKISRPALISYPEFKKLLADSDGFRQARRIIFFESLRTDGNGGVPYKYRIPMIGPKELCYKLAYELLFIEQNENIRLRFIREGEFKYPISFDFSGAYCVYASEKEFVNENHKKNLQTYKSKMLYREFNEQMHQGSDLQGEDLYTLDESEVEDFNTWLKITKKK